MDDWICPFCGKADPDFVADKLQFRCDRCHAVGMHTRFLRRLISREAFARLNACLKTAPVPHGSKNCPECRKSLAFFAFASSARNNSLAYCLACQWIWSEGEDFRHAFAEAGPSIQEKAELSALHRDRGDLDPEVTVHRPRLDGEHLSTHRLRVTKGRFNEAIAPLRHHDISKVPLYTLTILFTCVVTSLLVERLPTLRPYFVFDPRHPLAYGGLPLVLSGLLHRDRAHLLGNAIQILAFGWVLENELRHPRRIVFVFFGAVFCGGLFHFFFAPPSPVIGASGGARGLLAYYVMLFPWTKFTVIRNVREVGGYLRISMTSAAFLTMTLALDFLGAWATYTVHRLPIAPQIHLAPNIAEVLRMSLPLLARYLPSWYLTACAAHVGGVVFGILCAAWGTDLLKTGLLVSTQDPRRLRDGNPRPALAIRK